MRVLRYMAGGALLLASVPGFAEGTSVPTLGEVLKASQIKVSGYIDASAIYNTQGPFNTFHIYDQQGRSFNLQMLELSLSRLPDQGWGGAVVLNAGPDATINQSVPECDGSGNCPSGIFPPGFDVQQAYASYKQGNVQAVFGKLATLIGFEVIESPSNYNFSRSWLFGWGPFIQTGGRVYWQATPTLKAVFGVNNGWDQLPTNLTPKTVEAQLAWQPSDAFFISIEGDTGMQDGGAGGTTGSIGLRQIIDVVSTYNVTKALTLGLNAMAGYQGNAIRPGLATPDAAHWNGQALYANYLVSDKWRVAGRIERFDDASGFRAYQVGFPCGAPGSTGTTTCAASPYTYPSSQRLKAATITLAYTPVDSVELRGELRHDMSDKSVFVKTGGGTAKSQTTLAFETIYKF